MVEQQRPANPTTEEQQKLTQQDLEQKAAAELLNKTVKQLVGSAMGEFENTLKALSIAVNGQGAEIQRHSVDLELIARTSLAFNETINGIVVKLDELPVNVGDRSVRRRMNRSISTKGIIQYDGTVETHGHSREEFEAEQTWMDQLQNRLQPIYEEFVEPVVPGFSVGETDEQVIPATAAEALGITEEEVQIERLRVAQERILKEDARTP